MSSQAIYGFLNPDLVDAFRELLRDEMRNVIKQELQQLQPPPADETMLNAKETARLCGGVTVITVHNWSKSGKLRKYKVGGRVFWKRDEVLNAMK